MNPGSLARLHLHVAGMGVGAQGAPARHPSGRLGSRGGSLGGWDWEMGRAPAVEHGGGPRDLSAAGFGAG